MLKQTTLPPVLGTGRVGLDHVYWLDPRDYQRAEANLIHEGVSVATFRRNSNNAVFVRLTEAHLAAFADSTPWQVLQHLRATAVGDNVVEVAHRFGPLNSGSFRSGTRYYNLFADCFMVWHLKRTAKNEPIIVLSIKDRKGWEIATL